MPFDHDNVVSAINASLFFDNNIFSDDYMNSLSSAHRDPGDGHMLISDSSPPSINIVNGRLEFGNKSPCIDIGRLARLESLRQDHLNDAERFYEIASNLSVGFGSRVRRLAQILSLPLTEESSFRIANQVQGIKEIWTTLENELTPASSADIGSFVKSMIDFSNQFPAWREFLEDSEVRRPPVALEVQALKQLATVIQHQPSNLIADDLKSAVQEASEAGENSSSARISYLQRLIHNTFFAAGHYIIERSKGAKTKFNDKIEKEIGEGLASGLVNLILVASTPLLALMMQLPAHFGWVGPALAAARLLSSRK